MFGIMGINKKFKITMIKKNLSLFSILFVFIYLTSCGQQIMKDEGLESKNIESVGTAIISNFKIESVTPSDESTNVSRNIAISFTFDKEIIEWFTSTSSRCSEQLFKVSVSASFNTNDCLGFDNTCAYSSGTATQLSDDQKTLALCTPTLAPGTPYYIKVVASSDTGNLKSNDGSTFVEFNSSFTTEN